LWWEIEAITWIEVDVTLRRVERDRTIDAEEDLVIGMLMFPVAVARFV
jgi:hypothetical protein